MTVKRGGLAKSKRVRQTKKAGKSIAPAAEASRTPLPGESWHVTPGPTGATGFFFPEPGSGGSTSSEESPFETPSDMTIGSDEGVEGTLPESSPGPTSPPTTYGAEKPKVKGGPKKAKKVTGSGKRGEKGGLYGRIAKTTGTTRKEARGVMKRARRQIRSGSNKAAARRITRALSGGPAAGVRRTPARKAAAAAAGQRITKRIATRQRSEKKAGPGGGGKRRKK